MPMRWCTLLIILFSWPFLVLAQNPFVCDGSLFITIDQQVYRMQIDLENEDFSYLPLPYTSGVNLNAMGYRNTDNYIYGVADHLFYYTLCRIDASGRATILDTLDIDHNLTLPAGTVTDDGRYLIIMDVWTDTLANATNNLLFIDLESPNYTLTSVAVENQNGTRRNVFSADLVFDPNQRNLIGYDFYQKRLFRLNIDDPAFDFSGFPQVDNVPGSIPALFFDPFSQLYGYERNDVFNELYLIETAGGQIQKISKDDDLRLAPYRDGCSCPYTVRMHKTVRPAITYPCTEVAYTIKIGNLNQASQSNLQLRDQLPEGFILQEVLHNPYPVEIQGVGTNELHLDGFDLRLGTDSIVIKVSIPENAAGMYFNQATLSGLDLSLANDTRTTILSDFPLTEQIDDPTPLEVLAFSPGHSSTTLEFCPESSVTIWATPEPEAAAFEWDDGYPEANRIVHESGVYQATVTTGCAVQTRTFDVRETQLELALGEDLTVGYGDSLRLQPEIVASTPIAQYQWRWEGMGLLSCTDCASVLLVPEGAGLLVLEIWTENGCYAQNQVEVTVSRAIYAPNAFSPNFDGFNDYFTIYSGDAVSLVTLKVFDRWGSLVFEQNSGLTNTYEVGWDGNVRGKTAAPGIYAWLAEVEFVDGVRKQFSGDVVLMR